MNIVERVKKILVTPATEWQVIATEAADTASLITGYVLPLAGISALALFIGQSIVGVDAGFMGSYRAPVATGLAMAVFAVIMAVVSVFVVSFLIDAFAPTFGVAKDQPQAFKLAVYSFTPAWVSGVLQIIPALGVVAIFGALYGIYLLYLGLPLLMKVTADKAVGYTAAVVVSAFVAMLVLGLIGGLLIGAPLR